MKKGIILTILIITSLFTSAQENTAPAPSKTIQPKIIVMPKIAENENLKAFYDSNVNIQIAIAKISEAFLNRGANLKDFDATLKQVQENEALNKSASNQSDYKSKVLASSAADIYVEVKLQVVPHTARNAKSVNVILSAYQAGTSNSIASRAASSPMFQTDDIGVLTMRAMDTVSESFLNLMQLKFNDMRENGQSAYVEFTISPNSKYTFDSDVKGKLLSDVIDDWFAANSVKGVFNNQGVVENKMIISDVRIPLKRKNNPNANYTGQNLFSDIYSFFKTLGIDTKRVIGTNNKILITIL